MPLHLDHVALLARDLEAALLRAQGLGLEAGPIESFPGEGTREVYLGGDERSARLLLIQPLGAKGPYARALAKRGPGLHHLAVAVPDVRAAVATFSGWLLHPASVETLASSQTAWLARPGVPTLIEVCAGEGRPSPVVERIELPIPDGLERLLAALPGVDPSPTSELVLTVGGRRLPLSELLD